MLTTTVFANMPSEVRYAARTLWRAPAFAVVAIMTLALGIGANTAIFSVLNAVLLRSLPYPDADSLFQVYGSIAPSDNPSGPARRLPAVQVADLHALRTETTMLSGVAFSLPFQATLTGRGDAVRVDGARVTPGTLEMLGPPPVLGRLFRDDDAKSGAENVAILSYGFWQQAFGGTQTVLGETVTLDGVSFSVIGVMPQGFRFPDRQTIGWFPLVSSRFERATGSPIVRVKPGFTPIAAAQEITNVMSQIRGKSLTPGQSGGRPPAASAYELVGLQELTVAPVKSALVVLMGAVILVLLISCVNVASLLLARTNARQRDFAVRFAVGADRGHLLRQTFIEASLLSTAAGALGIGIAYAGVGLLQTVAGGMSRRDIGGGAAIPRLDEVSLDGSVLLFTIAVSVLCAILVAIASARRAQTASVDALRAGATSAGTGFTLHGRSRVQGLLVVTQIAMSTMLLIGSVLLVRSVVNLANVDLGYEPRDLVTAHLSLPAGRYATTAEFAAFAEELTSRLERVPNVRGVGFARQLPSVRMRQVTRLRFQPEMPKRMAALPPFDARQLPEAPDVRIVSKDFLRVMGVDLIAGRMFDETDAPGRAQVLLINETLANSGYLGKHPVGRKVYALGRDPWEVVGIVADIRQFGPDQEPDPQIFIDYRQEPAPVPPAPPGVQLLGPAPYVVIKATNGGIAAAASLRSVVRELEPQATVDNVATMQQLVWNSFGRQRLYAILLSIFAALAITLTAIGIYGLIAYSVAQRSREISIRMALGAQRRAVATLVIRQVLVVTSVGLVLGILAAVGLTRYLTGLLFGLTPTDPITYATVALALAGTAMLAVAMPMRRAMGVNQLVGLREE